MGSNKEELWKAEYLKCWNATEAAKRVGYRWPNKIGPRKLSKFADEIKEAIEAKKMTADEVLTRIAEHARGDIGDYAHISGSNDLAKHDLSRVVKKFKKKVWYDKDGEAHEEIELELYDSQSALQLLGKHLGLFTDRIEHTGSDGGPIVFEVTGIDTKKDI